MADEKNNEVLAAEVSGEDAQPKETKAKVVEAPKPAPKSTPKHKPTDYIPNRQERLR